MQHTVYLSLGSNLGNRHALLEQAITLLEQRVGCIAARSSFIETEPWGFESEHAFLNAAVKVRTTLTPLSVLHETQEIERLLGRERKSTDGTYHDRPIDIDILLYDDIHIEGNFLVDGKLQRLAIPHPHMYERDFVMVPLREIYSEEI